MKTSTFTRLFLAILVALGLSACASSGGSAGDAGIEGEGIAFLVINDRTPPAPVTVYLIPEAGGRHRLGYVTPNGRETFRYSPPSPSMEFHLVAEATGESDVRSDPFTLVSVGEIEWSTSARNVRVR